MNRFINIDSRFALLYPAAQQHERCNKRQSLPALVQPAHRHHIANIASTPFMIVVPSSMPATSLEELVALAKTRKMSFASAGVGTVGHVAELFKSMAEIDAVHVPYKGQGPAMSDLLAGRVDFMFSNPMVTIPFLREGSLRGLAGTSTMRMAAAPEIPTVGESWRAGFDATPWFGLPKGLPDEIIQQLSDAIAAMLKLDDFKDELAAMGATPMFEPTDVFAIRIANDIKKWVKVSRAKEN
jgi:tripartite-type tricarboxylate transporter receptor subunit TctC